MNCGGKCVLYNNKMFTNGLELKNEKGKKVGYITPLELVSSSTLLSIDMWKRLCGTVDIPNLYSDQNPKELADRFMIYSEVVNREIEEYDNYITWLESNPLKRKRPHL